MKILASRLIRLLGGIRGFVLWILKSEGRPPPQPLQSELQLAPWTFLPSAAASLQKNENDGQKAAVIVVGDWGIMSVDAPCSPPRYANAIRPGDSRAAEVQRTMTWTWTSTSTLFGMITPSPRRESRSDGQTWSSKGLSDSHTTIGLSISPSIQFLSFVCLPTLLFLTCIQITWSGTICQKLQLGRGRRFGTFISWVPFDNVHTRVGNQFNLPDLVSKV